MVVLGVLAALNLIEPRLDVFLKLEQPCVSLFQQPECLADDLAGRLIESRLNLVIDEPLEFRRQGNIHVVPPQSSITRNNKS